MKFLVIKLLLTQKVDKITRAFNRSGATRAVPLGISKAFDRVCHDGLHKLKSYGISGQMFGLISSSLSMASSGSGWKVFTRISS